jgi:hypothetical protein
MKCFRVKPYILLSRAGGKLWTGNKISEAHANIHPKRCGAQKEKRSCFQCFLRLSFIGSSLRAKTLQSPFSRLALSSRRPLTTPTMLKPPGVPSSVMDHPSSKDRPPRVSHGGISRFDRHRPNESSRHSRRVISFLNNPITSSKVYLDGLEQPSSFQNFDYVQSKSSFPPARENSSTSKQSLKRFNSNGFFPFSGSHLP